MTARVAARARTRRNAGLAAVEFAIMLPLLLLMALMLADFARALQAQIVLVNVSREGANLAARVSTYNQPQIMHALATTAPPLHMPADGMIYITTVMGHLEGGAVRNVVIGQSRCVAGDCAAGSYAATSAIWNCGAGGSHWAGDGSCAGIPSPGPSAPTAPLMTGQLADGETIYAVEVFYRFQMLFGAIDLGPGLRTPRIGPDLHAMTVL